MSRELKYRVWNSYQRKMFDMYLICLETGIVKCRSLDGETTHTFGLKDCELIQFTGLHDKNGKDIYEGDIVTRKYESGVFETCEIKFMDGSFCGWFEDEPDAYFNIGGDNHRHTVIGNIHENGDLI